MQVLYGDGDTLPRTTDKWISYEIDELMIPVLDFIISKCASNDDSKNESILMTVSYDGRPVEQGVGISELEKKYFEDIFQTFNIEI